MLKARLRSRWQKIRQRRVAIAVTTAIIVVAIALIIIGYFFDWTGFNGYTQVSTIHTISGPTSGTVTRTETYQPSKTLWDWLQLLGILAIPVVVGFGAAWFTTRQVQASDEENKDNQHENALQAYIDKMSELLLKEHLGENIPQYRGVGIIARARTLTVFRRLDAERKGSVLRFLHESRLIDRESYIIDLDGADLSGADLSWADLSRTNLMGANLSKANLSRAYLMGADLSRANLSRADLSRADLSGADLSINPDDQISKTVLLYANLSHANLTDANLGEAFLGLASLVDANLTNVNLTDADLTHTNLNKADLSEANLNGATGITIEQLKKQAKSLKGATMPDGSIYP